MSGRIDIHQHFLPDFYREALLDVGIDAPDGMASVPAWSPAAALATMDRLGIAMACVSISSPGVHFAGMARALELARRTNDAAAALRTAHPDRFRFFAVTPLPDVDAAVHEIRRALDELGASGVVFETSFDGIYLGDDRLRPVYEELDRRRAVLFLHPTSPHCRCGAASDAGRAGSGLALGYPRPMLEFMFETTRTVTDMILSGTLARYPGIRVVVPHAGACLPVLAGRIQLLNGAGRHPPAHAPHDIRAALRTLHYDLAGSPVPEALQALLGFADTAHLHYGSDWPFTPVDGCGHLLSALIDTPLLDGVRDDALGGNARALLGL